MDTTETYTKMCDCPEIQDNHMWVMGDWIWDKTNNEWNILCSCCHNYEHYLLSMYIWLPTQDQIQEMMKFGSDIPIKWHIWLSDITGQLTDYYERFTSMEQLWLAFYLKEKYNKFWDGQDWV